eukprot:m.147793 g.147793  ORF g.147793 m.147793 type:complete len:1129 (-) comp30562_c0_seq1:67-3453(-)
MTHAVNIDALFDRVGTEVAVTGGAQILSDTKRSYVKRILLESLLGCPRLQADGVPCYIVLWQIGVFLLPALLVLPAMFLVESNEISPIAGGFVAAALAAISIFTFRLLAWFRRRSIEGPTHAKISATDDEDDREFFGCWDAESIDFVLPLKRLHFVEYPIHLIMYMLLAGGGAMFLLPSQLDSAFSNNYAAAPVLVLFGAVTVLSAMYGLVTTPAPNPVAFRVQQNIVDVQSIHRAVYCVLLYLLQFCAHTGGLTLGVSQAVYILFALLPTLWFFGVLPPLDALIPWAIEQHLVILLGGSGMANDTRLFVMYSASMVTFGVTFTLLQHSSTLAAAAFASALGFLLSCDISSILTLSFFNHSRSNKVVPCDNLDVIPVAVERVKVQPTLERILSDVLILIVIICTAAFCTTVSKPSRTALDAVVYIVWLLGAICRVVQPVYVGFGLLHNPLYSASTEGDARKRQRWIGVGYRWLRRLSPIVVVAYVSCLFQVPSYRLLSSKILFAFGVTRAYRWASQSPDRAIFELALVAFAHQVAPSTSPWHSVPLVLQLVIMSAAHDRFDDLVHKINFMARMFYASSRNNKLRVSFTGRMLLLSLVFSPLILVVLLLSVVLASPILPLFGLPIFMISFPRPRRFWPNPGHGASPKPETIYYEQITPKLAQLFAELASLGQLGVVRDGSHHLLRFQDRTVHVQVLETGFDYTIVAFKGLELRETTSCHDLESTRIGEMFDDAFDEDTIQMQPSHRFRFNKHYASVLQPVVAAKIPGYSDHTYSQVGVIDSADTLRKVNMYFSHVLVWVLYKRLKREYAPSWRDRPNSRSTKFERGQEQFRNLVDSSWVDTIVQGDTKDKSAWTQAAQASPLVDIGSTTSHDALDPTDELQRELDEILSDDPVALSDDRGKQLLKTASKSLAEDHVGGAGVANQMNIVREMAAKCFASVADTALTPQRICDFFGGKVPSFMCEQPFYDPDLEAVILQAFRWAVKLALDDFDPTMDTSDEQLDTDELIDSLNDFEKNWHVGPEGSTAWNTVVKRSDRNLFSVNNKSSDPTNVKSRLITMGEVEIRMGELNPAAVRGQWASMQLELLYFTNDDDERYSIQAHETALRNLTIQSADAPLGYPVYNARLPLPL